MSANKVFGIDLGTTYSCISQVDRFGRPEVIGNMDGDATTPSVVQFQGDDVVVGKLAKRSGADRPRQRRAARQAPHRRPRVALPRRRSRVVGGRHLPLILGALAKDAERATGEAVNDVVITVPAYFGNEERKQTQLAGELAGMNVLDMINEPTAAAYAYGFARRARPTRASSSTTSAAARSTSRSSSWRATRSASWPPTATTSWAAPTGTPSSPACSPSASSSSARTRGPVRRRLRRGRPAHPGRGGQAVALAPRARRRARHQRRRPRERHGHPRGLRGGHAHPARPHDGAHPPRADGGRLQGRHAHRPLPARRRLVEDAGRRRRLRRSSASTPSSPTRTSPWPRARRSTARRSSSSAPSRRPPAAAST